MSILAAGGGGDLDVPLALVPPDYQGLPLDVGGMVAEFGGGGPELRAGRLPAFLTITSSLSHTLCTLCQGHALWSSPGSLVT